MQNLIVYQFNTLYEILKEMKEDFKENTAILHSKLEILFKDK